MPSTQESRIQELAQEHTLLKVYLSQLSDLILNIEEQSVVPLANLITEIEERCVEHMELEERDGYFPALRETMPHLSSMIDTLCGEHQSLKSELKQIAEWLSTNPDVDQLEKQIVPRIYDWLDSIRDHEHRENALLQEAYNTDLGSGD